MTGIRLPPVVIGDTAVRLYLIGAHFDLLGGYGCYASEEHLTALLIALPAAVRERVLAPLQPKAPTDEAWRHVSPVDLVLHCPYCEKQHLDIGEFQTRVHRKHLCENTPDGPNTGCGHLWKPYEYATRGVLEVEKPEDS